MIQYRGVPEGENKFRYGYLYEDITPHRHISYIIKWGSIPAASMPTSRFVAVEQKTVGQLTGLELKGKCLNWWEGDIIQLHGYPDDDITVRVIVKSAGQWCVLWYEGGQKSSIESAISFWIRSKYKVIGSIHTTPELLKGIDPKVFNAETQSDD